MLDDDPVNVPVMRSGLQPYRRASVQFFSAELQEKNTLGVGTNNSNNVDVGIADLFPNIEADVAVESILAPSFAA